MEKKESNLNTLQLKKKKNKLSYDVGKANAGRINQLSCKATANMT